ncbi:GDP-mannose dehydrogenase [Candidatus Desantisbacteria bacterium CG_4_8_14_3_um_filter_40_12]|uniref:UDP-glucose 6-dehydrogenase n=1 Tax=Candidatus Desantisbacteria bacterium CG_4_8_14_3_um_filter_40_12 TaxID=1974545 RepID=A0A2M7JCN2_9BACT|nr:MAG: GDP-mannose dehydrogenase [Candidatus Desantisbacteria bacterium CG_4_8_14_3_um_filter_40_12]
MKISVFGLGYVGCVSAACLAKDRHEVIGVDVDEYKVGIINEGKSTIVEETIGEILKETVENGMLRATTNVAEGILNSEVSLVCVGTPSNENGSLDLRYIRKVAEDIGMALRKKPSYHVIVMRSTMLPGSMEEVVIPILEQSSNKKAGQDFGICINPEFLREGTSVFDYYHPPKILIGEFDERAGDVVEEIYKNITAPVVRTTIKVAEVIKYASNTFHALKVCFANEIGNICKKKGIDSHEVMKIFCMDTKLNLSPYYLKPGFAYGGSCLPKDLRALLYEARNNDVEVPVLSAIERSNKLQIERGINSILGLKKQNIGILGLSFKGGTDDLRESPMVILVEALLGKGFCIKIYDKNVNMAKIFGANKKYIEKEIPHISSLMSNSINEVIEHADVLVIGNKMDEIKEVSNLIKKDTVVIDLVRINRNEVADKKYMGICW